MMYRDLHASLMRFCQTFANEVNGGVTPSFTNFDASFEDTDLPPNDLTGYFALTFTVDDGMVDGSFQVGYSTFDDLNLFRLVDAMDQLLARLLPMNKLTVYNADTGNPVGLMVIKNGTRLMPAVGSKTRPVQFIAVQFLTTMTYQLTAEVIDSV